jgi:ribose transport system ATP-binding protein
MDRVTVTADDARAAHLDDTILQLRGISKSFPGVKALDDVDFDVRRGEVHALLGENGAGKSTLMKVLAGTYTPDSGQILLDGRVVDPKTPLDAKRLGVLLVHQELSLVPGMSVAENIFLGSLPSRGLNIDWRKLQSDAAAILERLESSVSPRDLVGELSIANQQMVEIARALAFDPRIVVFDEPTSSLTEQEKRVLFKNIRRLQEQNVALVYISHRMDEIFELSDRITVLRDGRQRGTVFTDETNEAEVTRLMIGRELDEKQANVPPTLGAEVLVVDDVTVPGVVANASFTVRAGEVVGLYGLIGAGRSELAETIFGLRRPSSGTVRVFGQAKALRSPAEAVEAGIALVPEDRKVQGLVLGMGVLDNMTLPQIDELTWKGFVDASKERMLYVTYKEQLAIKTPGPYQATENLSGGNQQKIVIAKWLAKQPRLLILDEPTRGIDVGSKAEIHRLIRGLADEGIAVIVISSEMPEILGVSDRILTMYEGRITAEFDAQRASEDGLIAGSIGSTLRESGGGAEGDDAGAARASEPRGEAPEPSGTPPK